MNVGELLEILEGVDPEVEIHFASQPHYPLDFNVGTAVMVDMSAEESDDYEDFVDNSHEPSLDEQESEYTYPASRYTLYLTEGHTQEYLSGFVALALS